MHGICRLCICHDVFDTAFSCTTLAVWSAAAVRSTVKSVKSKISIIQISTILFQILKYKFIRGENGRLARWAGLVQLQPTRWLGCLPTGMCFYSISFKPLAQDFMIQDDMEDLNCCVVSDDRIYRYRFESLWTSCTRLNIKFPMLRSYKLILNCAHLGGS